MQWLFFAVIIIAVGFSSNLVASMAVENIIIREANLQDLDVLLGFEQGIVTTERPYDPTLKPGRINYYNLAAYITDTNIGVFVAELDSVVVGSGYALIKDAKPYLKHQQYAYLGFMYVAPAQRGKGINKMIIDALKKWALERHITEIRLEVYADNKNAIKAYSKVGFTPNLLEMRINLED